MGELVVQLLPEIAGLAVTPAAVIACLLLLDSRHPARNVLLFATAFSGVYAVLSVAIVLGASATNAAQGESDAKNWASLVVGVLFLLGAIGALLHKAPRRASTPGWARALEDPSPRTLLLGGAALSVINPNIAILLSGLSAVVTSEVELGYQLVGAALLLAGVLVDFVVPSIAYLVGGQRGHRLLRRAKVWLIEHNRPIGIGVLILFGLVFALRGAMALT